MRSPLQHLLTLAAFAVLAPLASARPLTAQQPKVAAKPPPGVAVHRLSQADLERVVCTGAEELTIVPPAGAWTAIPFGWFATDEETARANWKSMRYALAVEDRPLDVPELTEWETQSIHIECPGRDMIEGFGVSPMVYVPPLSGRDRTYRLTYSFQDDVNDGWGTYPAGSELNFAMHLRTPATAAAATWLDDFVAAANAQDVDAMMALYAPDVVSMPPDAAPRELDELRSMFAAEAQRYSMAMTVGDPEVTTAGDLAIVRVPYEGSSTPRAGGEPVAYAGLWLAVLKRQPDGAWKMWREMWSKVPPSRD